MKKRPKLLKRLLWSLLALFVLINIVACFHAYKFTHFASSDIKKTSNAERLTFSGKLKALFFGINNPRPENKKLPTRKFEIISLQSNKRIKGWLIPVDSAKGTIIIFHGYSGNKGSMLDKADVFNELGYNTFLIDFMGSGSSEGNQTTIGFYEAEEVKSAFNYIKEKGEHNIVLFGTSMGAAAIMKSVNDFKLEASALILECPFGTMLETVEARFKVMKVPAFPMAHLLVFWGGFQNNFNAFAHNPEDYAKHIESPVLLLYGAKDINVSRDETEAIFKNLSGTKYLGIYEEAGHENFLTKYKKQWTEDVTGFLEKHIALKK